MSCSKGNIIRTRPQKHQNRTAFKNNLHDTSKKTKILNNLEVTGVCERCKEIIEWKIKYKKYKPLTAPRKCIGCEQKNIKYAYHVLCTKCAADKRVCAKCYKPLEDQTKVEDTDIKNINNESKLQLILKTLPERKRRTLLRHIKKQEDGQMPAVDIEILLSEMEKVNLENDSDEWPFDEDSVSESEAEFK